MGTKKERYLNEHIQSTYQNHQKSKDFGCRSTDRNPSQSNGFGRVRQIWRNPTDYASNRKPFGLGKESTYEQESKAFAHE